VYLEDLYVTEGARGRGVGRRADGDGSRPSRSSRGWGRIDFSGARLEPGARLLPAPRAWAMSAGWLRYGADEEALRRLADEDRRD